MGSSNCRPLLIVSLILASWPPTYAADLQCLDGEGKAVAWWFIYKMTSRQYVYYEPGKYVHTNFVNDRTLDGTPKELTDDTCPLKTTLSPLYTRRPDANLWYTAYSDQPPGQGSTDAAHAKGVVAYDETTKKGFWLIHSQPNWPNLEHVAYEYCSTVGRPDKMKCNTGESQLLCKARKRRACAIDHAQSFLCVSFHDEAMLSKITSQLELMQIGPYKTATTTKHGRITPSLGPSMRFELFLDINGRDSFVHFAQSPTKTNPPELRNIYEFIATFAKDAGHSHDVWIWDSFHSQRGYATPQQMMVYRMQVEVGRDKHGAKIMEEMGKEHSKFGISMKAQHLIVLSPYNLDFYEATGLVCIGDLNRDTPQFKRGGGFMCFKDLFLAKVIKNSIKSMFSVARTPFYLLWNEQRDALGWTDVKKAPLEKKRDRDETVLPRKRVKLNDHNLFS